MAGFQLDYTGAELNETNRKALEPYSYVSYLPEGSDYTTGVLSAGIPTKTLVDTTQKSSNGFAFVDRGGGNFSLQFQGSKATTFKIYWTVGIKTSANIILTDFYMYRNDVMEPGVGLPQAVGTGADVQPLSVVGEFVANPGDFLEIYTKVSADSTVTFIRSSTIITEKN